MTSARSPPATGPSPTPMRSTARRFRSESPDKSCRRRGDGFRACLRIASLDCGCARSCATRVRSPRPINCSSPPIISPPSPSRAFNTSISPPTCSPRRRDGLPSFIRTLRFAIALGGGRWTDAAVNLTLTNSRWTASGLVRLGEVSTPRVLYPPVRDPGAGLAWADRDDTFLCIGRFHGSKRIEHGDLDRLEGPRRRHATGAADHRRIRGRSRIHDTDASTRRQTRRLDRVPRGSASRRS